MEENLVGSFDGISDLNIFGSMAVEALASALKKVLSCTTFWNCQRPGITLAAYPHGDFIGEKKHL